MLIKLNFCSCSSLVAATCVCSSTPWSFSSLSVFLDVRITKIPRGNVHQDAIRCGLVVNLSCATFAFFSGVTAAEETYA